jgi:hypothetical protein
VPLPSSTDLVNVTGHARLQAISPLLEVRAFSHSQRRASAAPSMIDYSFKVSAII